MSRRLRLWFWKPAIGVMRTSTIATALCGIAGCVSSLLPTPAPPPTLFTLRDEAMPDEGSRSAVRAPSNGRTLQVSLPRAAAGYDSSRIVYRRTPDEIDFFARNAWVDTPARMLAPLIARAVERTGTFHAVIDPSLPAVADLRLDSEIVEIRQDFESSPSRAKFVLKVALIDLKTRRIIASRRFGASEPASTEDPRGSVAAANRAVSHVLRDVAAFCTEASPKPD